MLAAVQRGGVGEGALQLGQRGAVVQAAVDAHHLAADRRRVGGADGVGDVVVVAAHYGRAFSAGPFDAAV